MDQHKENAPDVQQTKDEIAAPNDNLNDDIQ